MYGWLLELFLCRDDGSGRVEVEKLEKEKIEAEKEKVRESVCVCVCVKSNQLQAIWYMFFIMSKAMQYSVCMVVHAF